MDASESLNASSSTSSKVVNRKALLCVAAALAGVATVLLGATTIYWWALKVPQHEHPLVIWTAMIPTGGLVLAIAVVVLCYATLRSSE